MKIKFIGSLSKKEAKELLAFEGLEKMFKSLNLSLSADICRQIFEFAAENNDLMEDLVDGLGEEQTVLLENPANTAAMFRGVFEERKTNPSKKVGNSLISKGSTIGRFRISKNSLIPEPRPSLARNIKELYNQWRSNGIIDENGVLTQDMEVDSRNVAVGLSLGYSASANIYLPKEMDWN